MDRCTISMGLLVNDLTRMINIKQNHRQKHQRRIKDIQENLIGQQVSILTHNILDNTKHGTNHDQQADTVKDEEETLPWDFELFGSQGGHGADAVVEDSSDDDEESEEEDLNT